MNPIHEMTKWEKRIKKKNNKPDITPLSRDTPLLAE